MDRFKFRVWRPKNIYVNFWEPKYIYFPLDMGEYAIGFTETDIIEQCTGLKDKNGKLIYEGDWLKTDDGYYCYVVWFDGFWWVKSLPSKAMDLEHSEFYKECEVVGNIHENADLLGEE